MTCWNIRAINSLALQLAGAIVASVFFLSLATPARAAITGTCSYDVIPPQVRPGNSVQVVIALEPGGPRAICGQGGVNDNCYEIRTCEESNYAIGYYCHNNANFHSENQVIIRNWENTGIDVLQTATPGLTSTRRFWLEKVVNGVRNDNYCPGNYRNGLGPRGVVRGGCNSGWATVSGVGVEAGQPITSNDAVQVVFNADSTFGFSGGFAIGVAREDGSEYRRLGDVTSRPFDQQGRLDTAAGNTFNVGALAAGNYKFMIVDANIVGRETYCEQAFNICLPDDPSCTFQQETVKGSERELGEVISRFSFCSQVPAGSQRSACEECLASGGGTSDDGGYVPKDKLYTAVGCIRISQSGLAGDLIKLGLGIGGGLALVSILAAAFMFSTSQGDSNKLKEAKGLMTAAVAGLFFLIFSVIILNFIGVQILRIPGLS